MLGETITPTEAELVRAARSGDVRAYEQLVRTHQPAARRLAGVIGGADDADDITQLAFVKAFRALHRFELGKPFRPWLLQIVANEARTARRLAVRHHAIARRAEEHARAATERGPDALVSAKELREQLRRALESLSEEHRDVVACRFLLELSEQETSEALRIRAGTAKSRLSRALELLRKSLEPELAA
jgi:RNA polymerase sigma factor (sigma-70 family)